MKRSGFFVSLSAAPTCRERRLDGMGESRVREIRLPGLTSGDWKRSNAPNRGTGNKRKQPDNGYSSGPTATAPVVDSTRRNVAVRHEDEEILPRPLDHALELDASRMGRRKAHEFVEAGIEPRGIGFQGRVGEPFSSPPDPAGAAQQMPKLRREDVVAGVDGILHVADEM